VFFLFFVSGFAVVIFDVSLVFSLSHYGGGRLVARRLAFFFLRFLHYSRRFLPLTLLSFCVADRIVSLFLLLGRPRWLFFGEELALTPFAWAGFPIRITMVDSPSMETTMFFSLCILTINLFLLSHLSPLARPFVLFDRPPSFSAARGLSLYEGFDVRRFLVNGLGFSFLRSGALSEVDFFFSLWCWYGTFPLFFCCLPP